jgi:hypothetical protein
MNSNRGNQQQDKFYCMEEQLDYSDVVSSVFGSRGTIFSLTDKKKY